MLLFNTETAFAADQNTLQMGKVSSHQNYFVQRMIQVLEGYKPSTKWGGQINSENTKFIKIETLKKQKKKFKNKNDPKNQ